jgi:hypothetical protein
MLAAIYYQKKRVRNMILRFTELWFRNRAKAGSVSEALPYSHLKTPWLSSAHYPIVGGISSESSKRLL